MVSHSSATPAILRSVSDIITSLKNSPRNDANFMQAELELQAKEKLARSYYDVLEEKYSSLKLQVLHLEGENRRLARECEFNKHMYQHAKDDIGVLERRNDELGRELEKIRSCFMDRVRMLEEEVESSTRVLGEINEKARESDERIEGLKRCMSEKDKEISVLRRIVDVLKAQKSENEAEIKDLRRRNAKWLVTKYECDRKIETLTKMAEEMEKAMQTQCEDFRRILREVDGEAVRDSMEEKDEVIENKDEAVCSLELHGNGELTQAENM